MRDFTMPLKINEVGNRYGKLFVAEEAESEKGACWRCKCDCGRERIVRGVDLRNKKVRSCVPCSKHAALVNRAGIAPCERGCESLGSCRALELACELYARWVRSGGRVMPDPMKFPPTREIFNEVMASNG